MSNLGLVGAAALALAAAAARGSRAAKVRPDLAPPPSWMSPGANRTLQRLSEAYKVQVLADELKIYLIAPARRLISLLASDRLHRSFLTSLGMRADLARSYADNATVWDGLGDVVLASLDLGTQGESKGRLSDWGCLDVIPIPNPGHPLGPTWSVAKGRMIPGRAHPPFRFCDQPPVSLGSRFGQVLLEIPKVKPRLFLSHGVSMEGLHAMASCGGMLWPSFALTWRVPYGYGDVVFLADVGVIRQIVKPTGRPSALKHVYLAATDIWSPTARDLLGLEREVEEELSGTLHHRMSNSLKILSATSPNQEDLTSSFSYASEQQSVLTNRVQSVTALARHINGSIKTHGLDFSGDADEDSYRFYRYPYAEMKVVGRVPASLMPGCLYPEQMKGKIYPLLDAVGFLGERIPFSWTGGPRSSWTNDRQQEKSWAEAATAGLHLWSSRIDKESDLILSLI